MDLQKNLFAKKDIENSYSIRNTVALKIASKKFFNGNFNAPAILFAVTHDYNDGLTGYQRNAISAVTLSKETAHLAKEFYLDVFYDIDSMVKYLNKEISDRWYRMKRKPEKTFNDAQKEVESIIKVAMGGNFFNNITLDFDS